MSGEQLVDIGGGHRYMSDRPSRRFPVYTRGNAGEVYPEPYYPLSWSLSADEGGAVFESAARQGGLVGPKDFAEDAAVSGGVFAGYAYLNLSLGRVTALRLPGADIDDVDRSFLGGAEAPPHVPHPDDRDLRASLRGLRAVWQTMATKALPQLDADRARVQRWLGSLPPPAATGDDELRRHLEHSRTITFPLFETHLVITGRAGLAQGALANQLRDQLGDESLVLTLTAGLGDVASAEPSVALWDLGRQVAASPVLTTRFDRGVDAALSADITAELTADQPDNDMAVFARAFGNFLDRHGCRGPNEWETACPTWGTRPELALALVDRMRTADADRDPRVQAHRLRDQREQATIDVRARLGRVQRWFFDHFLRAAQIHTVGRERSKTTVIEAIHGVRLMANELAARTAVRSGGRPDDLWFVLADELEQYIADPRGFADVIAARRATRQLLADLEPPFFFDGAIPPIDTWPRRATTAGDVLTEGAELTGIPGAGGRACGRARIVTDPARPGDLGPGDVLVAPSTDPAWTPLFVPAAAVVVDVGAQLSHAVIVSRELGLPCVVSATDATRRIPSGALVEVDGDRGVVRIIATPTESEDP